MPVQAVTAESSTDGERISEAPRRPRSRERGFGRKQTLELLQALNDPELFKRRDDIYTLSGTRADLAKRFSISRQALSGRLSRLEKYGILVGRNPLRIDSHLLVLIGLGGHSPGAEQPRRPESRPEQRITQIREKVEVVTDESWRVESTEAVSHASAAARECAQREEELWELERMLVNVCSSIKCLLSTFDNALSMFDCFLNLNQTNQTNQTFTGEIKDLQEIITRACEAGDQTFTNRDQTFTNQTFTSFPQAAPVENFDSGAYDGSDDYDPECLRPAERVFGPNETPVTHRRLDELVDRWVQSWNSDVAERVTPPSPSVLYKVCRQYPESWCHRAMRLITRDMNASGSLRNPGALMYVAARDGRLAYFPEQPPTPCDHCEDGVLISPIEKCCHECEPRLRKEEREQEAARAKSAKEANDALNKALDKAEAEALVEYEKLRKRYVAKYGENVREDYLKAVKAKKMGKPRSEWESAVVIGQAFLDELRAQRDVHSWKLSRIMSGLPVDGMTFEEISAIIKQAEAKEEPAEEPAEATSSVEPAVP